MRERTGKVAEMAERVHQARQFRSTVDGVEAVQLVSNHSFPRHFHDQFGIGILLAGAQKSWSGIGSVEAGAGDVITVNPGEMHDGKPIGATVRHWQMLYLDPRLLNTPLKEEKAGDWEFPAPQITDKALFHLVAGLFSRTISDAGQLATEEALLYCLMHLTTIQRPVGRKAPDVSYGVALARQKMDDDPAATTTLAELAAISGIGRFQLLRRFLRETGATPHAYLMQSRVRLARHLLASGQGLADTALLAGFSDQSHLTRCFVRQFGVTPGKYAAASR